MKKTWKKLFAILLVLCTISISFGTIVRAEEDIGQEQTVPDSPKDSPGDSSGDSSKDAPTTEHKHSYKPDDGGITRCIECGAVLEVDTAMQMTEESTTSSEVSPTTESLSTEAEKSEKNSDDPKTTEELTTEDPRLEYAQVMVSLDEENGNLEQIQAKKPLIRAYFYLDSQYSLSRECMSVTLGSDNLRVEDVHKWGQDTENDIGINYYILLDVSTSMDENDFFAAKEEISEFADKYMKAGDTLTVYTVGNSPLCILEDKTIADVSEIEEIISDIELKDDKTYLDQALTDVTNRIHQKRMQFDELSGSRDIILAFTDGSNDSPDGVTHQEAVDSLCEEGITLYVFFAHSRNMDQEDRKEFESLAKRTGGGKYTYSSDSLSDDLNDLITHLQSAYVADCIAPDNIQDDSAQQFNLVIYEDEKQQTLVFESMNVVSKEHIPDSIAPFVIDGDDGIKKIDNTRITLAFSESVLGADSGNNYLLTYEDGTSISVEASYDDVTYTVTLTSSQVLYKGHYSLEISNITDNTQEKNGLEKTKFEMDFDGEEYSEDKEGFFQRFWWLILLIFVVVIIIILAVVLIIIKKHKGIIVVEDKAAFASETEVKQHVILEQKAKGEKITLFLHSGGKMIKKIDAYVDGSVIVGRSDLCDIFIDDQTMSRQHFAIESDGESFYIQDLDTTNGTMLNGVKITHKRRLDKNDRITAGSLDIVVRW